MFQTSLFINIFHFLHSFWIQVTSGLGGTRCKAAFALAVWGEVQHKQLPYKFTILQFLRAAILHSWNFRGSFRRFQRIWGITVGEKVRSSAADWKLEATTAFLGYWTESYTRPTQKLLWLLLAAHSPEEPINGKKGLARAWMKNPKAPPCVRALRWVSKDPLCWFHFHIANIFWLVLLATSLFCDWPSSNHSSAQLSQALGKWSHFYLIQYYELENKQSWFHQGTKCSLLRSIAECKTLMTDSQKGPSDYKKKMVLHFMYSVKSLLQAGRTVMWWKGR